MTHAIPRKKDLDLTEGAQRLLNFLQLVDGSDSIYSGPRFDAALYAYETKWLTQLSATPLPSQVPPLDVHWVWVVHQLCPTMYREDCLRLFGGVAFHDTAMLAKHAAGEPPSTASPPAGWQSSLQYDLRAASLRQSA